MPRSQQVRRHRRPPGLRLLCAGQTRANRLGAAIPQNLPKTRLRPRQSSQLLVGEGNSFFGLSRTRATAADGPDARRLLGESVGLSGEELWYGNRCAVTRRCAIARSPSMAPQKVIQQSCASQTLTRRRTRSAAADMTEKKKNMTLE